MSSRYRAHAVRGIALAAIAWSLATGWLAAEPARAGKLAELNTSLNFVPDDAAFYCSMLRKREQFDMVAESNAWARLRSMPSVEQALKLFEARAADPDKPAAKFKKALEHPALADLLALVCDMFGQDVFVFGSEGYADFVGLLQEVGNTINYGPAILHLTGQAEGIDEDELYGRLLLKALADNVDSIQIPTTIIGFKVTEKDRARRNLENLAGLIARTCAAVPQLYDAFQRKTIEGHEYLVVTLEGKKVPWDQVPVDELRRLETNQGDTDKVIDKAKQLKLVFAIGLRDDYLLILIGESTDVLAGLGQGDLLIDRAELKPLERFAEQQLTSVGYISRAMNRQLVGSQEDIDELVKLVEQVLPHSGLPGDEQAQIRRDAAALAEDIKTLVPEPGAGLSFSFMTDRGMESYSYNWSENLWLDGSKPLTLLEHVGGNPLLSVVMRERYRPEDYDLVAKWCPVIYRYFKRYAVPQMSRRDREKFEQFVDLVRRLPRRLDRANRELLIPALAEGQSGLVLDAKLRVRKLFDDMPDPGKPMPMLEPAVVVGVSDAQRLRQACSEYSAVFEAVLDALRQVEPGEIPEFEIPEPHESETDVGTIYAYRLPSECPVTGKIAPSIGLSDSVAVVALTPDHARRLLAAASLSAGGLLADPQRPRAVAFQLDWPAVVEAATPWVEFIAREIIKEKMDISEEGSEGEKAQAAAILEQVHTVLDVLKALHAVTCESYFEEGALVTHCLAEFRDIQ